MIDCEISTDFHHYKEHSLSLMSESVTTRAMHLYLGQPCQSIRLHVQSSNKTQQKLNFTCAASTHNYIILHVYYRYIVHINYLFYYPKIFGFFYGYPKETGRCQKYPIKFGTFRLQGLNQLSNLII